MTSVEQFLALSELLTGHDGLADKRDVKTSLAESYYQQIKDAFGAQRLDALLATFNAATPGTEHRLVQIMQDQQAAAICQEIIMLWYMSAFRGPGNTRDGAPKTPEQYFQGLFWPTIRAHPLGLSGGYFGYWKYPPEN